MLHLESLETRQLLSGPGSGSGGGSTPVYGIDPVDLDVKNGPLANTTPELIQVYKEYHDYLLSGRPPAQYRPSNRVLRVIDGAISLTVRYKGDQAAAIDALQAADIGMFVTSKSDQFRMLSGWAPIASLKKIATLNVVVGVDPNVAPRTYSRGVANNQAEDVLGIVQALQNPQYANVTGQVITVGVLSDSVNRFQGGLNDSISTGDLPPLSRINVLLDEPTGPGFANSDEGRAMMELIYDLAPGANLAYHTAFIDQLNFADGIRLLSRSAGAQVIVDDVGYRDEPFYQVGPIEQAISDVVRRDNRIYLSAAGNQDDQGFESPFRSTTATVGGSSGVFMDFDPGPGVTTQMQITLGAGTNVFSQLVMQYDQPFFTTSGVVSDVDVLVLDGSGAVVASSRRNNVQNQSPLEVVDLTALAGGTYTVAVYVASGPAPGRIQLSQFSDRPIEFAKTFGNAGGITYPTTIGHSAGLDTIGVAAVNFFDAPPFSTAATIPNASYSSFGPRYLLFDAAGNRLSLPDGGRLQRPQLSAPDATNTTFFIPGNDLPQDPDTFPNFTGTSAAAPNLAGLVALMRQVSPNVTQADVLAALKASARPVNGAAPGVWNVQGGFGLPSALASLQAVDNLRVVSTTPASGAVLSSVLTQVTVQFNKPVNASTLQAADLAFTQTPPGVTATPTSVALLPDGRTAVFTVRVTRQPGFKANGAYAYRLAAGAISSTDGRALAEFSSAFTVSDTTSPRVTGVDVAARRIRIAFSEAMDPATITAANVRLVRRGTAAGFGQTGNVIISNLPGYAVVWDPSTNSAVIDLSQIPQDQLPSDDYQIRVEDVVTDVVGNRLDGEFNGFFPSGNGSPLPGEDTDNDPFVYVLQDVVLRAPSIQLVQLLPADDSGIKGDQNTNVARPRFVGRVTAAFPGTVAGLQVVVQFNALHNNVFDLQRGPGGRGFTVQTGVDAVTTTDANGEFTFQAPSNLPNGFLGVRVIVVGQPDRPPQPGLSAQLDTSFRVDTTNPILRISNVTPNPATGVPPIPTLSTLDGGIRIVVEDPVLPDQLPNALAVPLQFLVPALDPATATNISNYRLLRIDPVTGAVLEDRSSFITGAVYTDNTDPRQTPADPFTGRIDLSFAPGLPAGRYRLVALRPSGTAPGVTDAAGNAIDGDPATAGAQDLTLTFDFQPTPTYVTNIQAISPVPNSSGATVITGPREFYEIPSAGTTARAVAPPEKFWIDFSGPLFSSSDPTYYTDRVQLIRSANAAAAPSDGDFGVDPFYNSGGQFTRVAGTTVRLINSVLGATYGQPGYRNRLEISLAPGTTLPADKYRLFVPNAVVGGRDLRLMDLFGNQIDGEFLGNPTPSGGWETLLPTGAQRPGMTGDLVEGGSLVTGFTVVPNGNVIFARPDYVDDPFLTSDDPDGSFDKPFPALAPEAVPDAANRGDLNSSVNFGTGFNPNLDLNGNGRFDRSAFFEASRLSARGPVVVVALPAQPGDPQARTFVLQRPNQAAVGRPTIADGSATVPFNTTFVMQAGSILKMRDASLYVQNQGSAIQLRGGPNPNQQVIVTSYLDDSVGGDTNRDNPLNLPGVGATPRAGDFGGIVLRNFDDTSAGGRPIPVTPGPDDPSRPQQDGRTNLGISGADDALSYFNFGQIRYGGGTVPQTLGFRFDAITLFNSRPAITNMRIDGGQVGAGVAGAGSQGGISVDMDSLREDTLGRGPLVRRTTVQNTSINGIYVRAELNGVIQPTDAIRYPDNPNDQGGDQNYTFDDPLPYAFVARMLLGSRFVHNSGLSETTMEPRVYVQPGMILKFQRGAAIDVTVPQNNVRPSLNVGDRTYINQFDRSPSLAPTDANFVPQKVGDARVIFTSFFDDAATTEYVDPFTGARTTIVPPVDSDNGGGVNQPSPGNVPDVARWGSVRVDSGAVAVIDEAEFRYGGGTVNVQNGTIPARQVLSLINAGGTSAFGQTFGALGTRAYITNNNFLGNLDSAVAIDANGLLQADPLRPLQSGNPYFRGNVFTGNDLNGVEVIGVPQNRAGTTWVGYPSNLDVDSIWDDTDVPWILRTTLILGGARGQISPNNFPVPPTSLGQQLRPHNSLTLRSSLPDTLLADGTRIGRPGESLLVKLLNDPTVPPIGTAEDGMPAGSEQSDSRGGAGFLVGMDDGNETDPDLGVLVDPGALSQIRILGVPGNETTGQQRVPVILTSLRDDSVGKTVRGVTMTQGISPAALAAFGYANGTAPQRGDGGVIGFGANSLFDYNLYDLRDGNVIDNADIRYMTRIEVQGGGYSYSVGASATRGQNLGLGGAAFQYNMGRAITFSNNNLSDFSQVGVIAHPSGQNQISIYLVPPDNQPPVARGTLRGAAVVLNMVNNTLANMPTGVRINSETTNNDQGQTPYQAIFMHNTFHNVGVGIRTQAPDDNGQNSLSHVHFYALNNIFSNVTDTAVRTVGQAYNSQLFYNLYSNVANQTDNQGTAYVRAPFNAQPITGAANFRGAASGDFALTELSDAIDASISEIKQSALGNALLPIADQRATNIVGVRNTRGRSNPFGGLGGSVPGDIITLPGFPAEQRGFFDQMVPVPVGTPGSLAGFPGSTVAYLPIQGERDQAGFLRQDDPGRANVGFGSRPFFDVGAFEYRELFPPTVTDVLAVLPNSGDPLNPTVSSIYVPGGVGGTNLTPLEIRIRLNQRIDPTTVNNLTVLLQASGGDGLFGNANNSQDRFIPLSGKLSYDEATNAIVIGLSSLGLSLGNDLYRIVLRGQGSDVIRNTIGLALDGENTAGGTPDGAQLPLPAGNGIPGGDFFVTFSVDTNPPAVVAGTLRLAPQADLRPNDNITNDNTPTFLGSITDIPPPLNPLVNQTVTVDVDTNGDGTFDVLNAGTATTDGFGAFQVTITQALPDSPYNVGPDGILGTADDTGYSVARIRVTDPNGNQSNPNDPNALFRFVVDTKSPVVTGATPSNASAITAPSGRIEVTLDIDENLMPESVTADTIRVIRSGGDGVFGDGNDATVPIDPNSIRIEYLRTGPKGPVRLRFTLTGVNANDVYRVALRSDSGAVTDLAGNPVVNGTGGDFLYDFTVLDPTLSRVIYVAPGGSPSPTGDRSAPYGSIRAGIAAANIGDTVAVIGGTQATPSVTYRESITLKSLVQVVSADPSSFGRTIVPGLALKTVIAAPLSDAPVTVRASNLTSLPAFPTRLSGFTIASPLTGNSASGPIISGSIGVLSDNSDLFLDRNVIITSGIGVLVQTAGVARSTQLGNNVIVGNVVGVRLSDLNGTTTGFASGRPTQLLNNTFAFNTNALELRSDAATGNPASDLLGRVYNNIFWQSGERTILHQGLAISASNPGRLDVRGNLFSSNGPSLSSPADDTANVGGGFNPALLTPGVPDALGNTTGDPSFVSPLDPRPEGNGPGNFFLGANYDITSASAAIDNAIQALATPTDARYRGRFDVPGRGFAGPADIGAFEFNGVGGIASGASRPPGSFAARPVNTLGVRLGAGATQVIVSASAIAVRFATNVNRASVQASDLLLSGTGLDPTDPARAVSVTWLNNRTVRFNLTGRLNPGGRLQVDIAPGAIRNADRTAAPAVSQALAAPASASGTVVVNVTQPRRRPAQRRQVAANPQARPQPRFGSLLSRLRGGKAAGR
jgi:hypothetical protein